MPQQVQTNAYTLYGHCYIHAPPRALISEPVARTVLQVAFRRVVPILMALAIKAACTHIRHISSFKLAGGKEARAIIERGASVARLCIGSVMGRICGKSF